MTTRELREILYEVQNQDMTVSELRGCLFAIENQDNTLPVNELRQATVKTETAIDYEYDEDLDA